MSPSSETERASYWRQMREIMYQPLEVWLATDKAGNRWLTDQYVMLDITGSEEFAELPDGAYKIAFISKGPEPREAPVDFDVEKYIERINHHHWWPATPTKWSFEESANDRAMLWDTYDVAALGRDTWKAISRFYPDCKVECASWKDDEGHRRSVFRFFYPSTLPPGVEVEGDRLVGTPTTTGTFGTRPGHIFAYAASIRIPEDLVDEAHNIVNTPYMDTS